MRYFALTALFLLFVVLTPGLLVSYFPRLSFNSFFVHIRRALGVSVFFFALFHAIIGFFYNLSGSISSLVFLSGQYQLALAASSTALFIFSLLALTSFDIAVKKLGKRWKLLHRCIYVAAILSVFHAFLIGSHFTTPTGTIPVIVNMLALTFILLEVGATVKRTMVAGKKLNVLHIGALALLVVSAFYLSNKGLTNIYDPHARHRKGYSKDYVLTVNTAPKNVSAGQPVNLTLFVTDKRTRKTVKKFLPSHEKLMHLMIVRSDL